MDSFVNEIINIIIVQVQKSPLNRDTDISLFKEDVWKIFRSTEAVFTKEVTQTFNKIIKTDEFFTKIVVNCIGNITKNTVDGKINVNDTSSILSMIHEIYENVSNLNQQSGFKIPTNMLICLVGAIIKSILVFIVHGEDRAPILDLVSMSVELVKFSMIKTPGKSLCC